MIGERRFIGTVVLSFVLAGIYAPAVFSLGAYQQINEAYQSGLYQTSIVEAKQYLAVHPSDGDVRLVLAKSYIEQKEYIAAREELFIILRVYPNYVDARLLLINIALLRGRYAEALAVLNEGLQIHPTNSELIKKRTVIYNALREQRQKHDLRLRQKSAALLEQSRRKRIEHPKRYLNEVGIYQQQYYISDRDQVWNYSTLYYGRQTPLGKIYAKTTYDNRLSKEAVQGEIEAFPIITKDLYLDVDFAFANQPNLFPDKAIGVEAYFSIFKAFNHSFGFRYDDINFNHHLLILSGSISKSFGKNSILFRPYYFTPGVGRHSALYIVDLRHTMVDPYYYVGCILGTGSSPDLANLVTVNFIKLQNKIVNPYVAFPLMHERLVVNLGVLLQNQIFENGHIRNWYGGTIGLNWKF